MNVELIKDMLTSLEELVSVIDARENLLKRSLLAKIESIREELEAS